MVLDGEWINGRPEKELGSPELLGVFSDAEDHCIMVFNKRRKIAPQFLVRPAQVHMATPDPWTPLAVMVDHGQGLRVVDDDHVVVQVGPDGIFVYHLFENFLLPVGKVDLPTLQGIVHLFGDAEEVREPWMIRQPVLMPTLFIRMVIEPSSSATPPP